MNKKIKPIRIVAMLLLVTTTFMMASCSKEKSSKNDVYYVKYDTYFYHGSGPWFVLIDYLTPDTLSQAWLYDSGNGNTFTTYAGPFSKGDRTYIGYAGTYNKGNAKYSVKNWLSISVKKNDEPFVEKKSVIDSDECEYYIE